jgi:hypothetical protein
MQMIVKINYQFGSFEFSIYKKVKKLFLLGRHIYNSFFIFQKLILNILSVKTTATVWYKEMVSFANAHQDSQVKNAIPEIHAHQIQ